MINVPFADLRVTNDEHALITSIMEVLRSGHYIGGPYVEEFEKLWANICNVDHCCAVQSGTAALISAAKAFAFPYQKEIKKTAVLPAFSYAATAFALYEAGYDVIYCDVLQNGCMDQDLACEALNTYKASNQVDLFLIVPVHIFGQIAQISKLLHEDACIIEDAAQAHGVFTRLQGDVACFSFYPSKNLGTVGNGGAVVTNRPELANYVKLYTNLGDYPDEKYKHRIIASNCRMTAIEASALVARLKTDYLLYGNERRKYLANLYDSEGIPSLADEENNSYHLYPILVKERDDFRNRMQICGITTGNHYPYTLDKFGFGIYYDVNVASRISKHCVTLPIGPHVTSEMALHVIEAVHELVILDDDMWYLRDAE